MRLIDVDIPGLNRPTALILRGTQDSSGKVSFLEFFESLGPSDQTALASRLQMVALFGWSWLRSNSRSVGQGVYELRQPRPLRSFWMRYGESSIVLLGGLAKNRGPREQSRAIGRARDLAALVRLMRS